MGVLALKLPCGRCQLRGMAANKIGCARISMMVRSTSSKARPDTLVQDRTPGSPFSLATHGGSIHFGGNADIKNYDCGTGVTAGPVSFRASFATMAGSARFGETVQQKTVVRP